ncbi:MAG: acyl-CoA dehydrogenase family protein [Candidatus Hodarchaeota archaeon]
MDFELSQDEQLFRDTVRDFAQKEIRPHIREMDEKGEMPKGLVKKMAELGLLGITIPEKYGGAGGNFTLACIAAEELARADLSIAIPVFYLVEASWAWVFARHGTEEAKQEILPKVASGEYFFGIATTEPAGGSDIVGATKTTITEKGDKYVVNGEKVYISGVRESMSMMKGRYFTLAYLDKGAKPKHRGLAAFILPVEKDTPGLTPTLFDDWGRMGISTGGFAMENVEIPKHWLIGDPNRGFVYSMEGFSAARVIIAATCIGAALGGLEIGMDYIKQRKAFGKELGKYEGINFPLAEWYSKLMGDRLVTYKAAWLMDQVYSGNTKYNHFDIANWTAMAKLRAPIDAFAALNEVADWHGAFGYTKECLLDLGIRGVRSYSIGAEGGMNIMRIIIARELLGKEFVPYDRLSEK